MVQGKGNVLGKAYAKEARQIKELIDHYARQNKMLPRSLSEIYEHIRDFMVYRKNNEVIGCCALYVTWEDLAEIKSLAVHPDYVRKGLGSKLMRRCLAEAKEMKIPRIFTLTVSPEFFIKQGFKSIPKSKLPIKIWGECVHCDKYPDCDERALIYKTGFKR